WPGNVRELKNTVTRALAFSDGRMILAEDILLDSTAPALKRSPAGTAEESIAPLKDAKGEGQPEAAGDDGPQSRGAEGLNARQRGMLHHLRSLGSVSRQQYQELAGSGISMRTAQYDLQCLVRQGVLRKEGRGPAQRYVYVGSSARQGAEAPDPDGTDNT
ncbi:MAG: hypothetical protein Q4F27_05190, partial [Desulfovibrionaceae bacterium]|nr:hypothetical protein [Desulfovibrionaceae bacterium]